MKLKEYIEKLQQVIKDNPEAAEFEVIYSRDDEGNGYQEIAYDPTIGFYEDDEFISAEDDDFDGDPNVVCIN